MNKVKLYIATPVHGWEISSLYWATMDDLRIECQRLGWDLMIRPWFGVSDLIKRRNVDVHRFLSTDCTHLITFDSDQGTDAVTFVALANSGRDLTAAPVPKKAENLPLSDAWNFICENGPPVVEHDFMRVAVVGSGCMCITRELALEMCYHAPVFMVEGQPVPELYAKDFVDRDKLFPTQLSEDYTFCMRARELDVQPWIWVPGKVMHMGVKTYRGELHA